MNGPSWYYILAAILQYTAGLLPPLALLVFAIVRYSSNPKAMALMISGSALIFLSALSSLGLNFYLSQALGAAQFGQFVVLHSIVSSILHAIGLLLIGGAAFVRPNVVNAEVVEDHVSAPKGPSPYQSG